MRRVPRLGLAGLGLVATFNASAAAGCELRVTEHRSGREVLVAALPGSAAPEVRLGFIHSVLGTPVEDRYEWRGGHWVLVEERFEGEGYGLPHMAGPDEQLERLPGGGARLRLARTVEPLVVRPLPAQRMRLTLEGGRSWLLGELASQALELRVAGCMAAGR